MPHTLVFVLAPEAALPADGADWELLQQAQLQGIGSGAALRLFQLAPDSTAELEDLVSEGWADVFGGGGGRGGGGSGESTPELRIICDAVVPQLEPRTLWLGVYGLSGVLIAPEVHHPAGQLEISECRCLDRFPLREAENETCWFYPTDNGRYLCWENQRQLQSSPGFLPDQPLQEQPLAYDRSDVHVLWTLMADDLALTCVGLTYRGQRIEWSSTATELEPWATWSSFEIDSMAEQSYRESSRITVFAPGSSA